MCHWLSWSSLGRQAGHILPSVLLPLFSGHWDDSSVYPVWWTPCFLPVLWDAGCWRPFSPAPERSIKHNDLAHSSRVCWGCSWEGLWSLSDVERQKLSVEKLICQQYVLEYECISVYSPLQQYNKRQYVLQILFVKQCWDSYPINIFIVNIELLSLLGLLKVPIVLWIKL